MGKYLKAVHYVLVAVLAGGVGVPFLNGQGLNGVTLIAAAGALAVYVTKNTPKQPWARTVTSLYVAAGGALTAAATTSDGVLQGFAAISGAEWQQILFLALGGATVLSSSDEDGPVDAPAPLPAYDEEAPASLTTYDDEGRRPRGGL